MDFVMLVCQLGLNQDTQKHLGSRKNMYFGVLDFLVSCGNRNIKVSCELFTDISLWPNREFPCNIHHESTI